jgi:hypothetical protein
MKLFISWSGPLSHKVAIALKEWLPSVIQSVKPYVSSEDIDKGARWSTDIAKELEASTYGIICLTKDNITAPWINFEAGALAKALDKSYVAPFLFNLKPSDVEGPLVQFQSVVNEKDDVYKMITSINSKVDSEHRLEATPLKKYFDAWWPQLAKELRTIHEEELNKAPRAEKARRDPTEILEELLELVRSQHRLITFDVGRSMEENFSRVLQEISQLRIQEAFRVQPYGLVTAKLEESPWPGYVTGLAGVVPRVTPLGDVMRGTIEPPVEGKRRKDETSAPSVNKTQKTDENTEDK